MANNNSRLHTYQDDLDTSPDKKDEATEEITDDPTKTFHIPPEEFKDELKKYDQAELQRGHSDPGEIGDQDETQR